MKPTRNDSTIVGLRTVRRKAALAAYGRRRLSAIFVAGAVLAALSSAQTAKAVNVVGDANAETTISPSNTIIKMTQNGTLTVTEPGEIEILLVGGGGGAGKSFSNIANCHGGGGGGGGVVHVRNHSVAAGEYPITVGAGGTVNDGNFGVGTGGNTTGFDYTAIGGGPGAAACGIGVVIGNRGASGGGGTRNWDGSTVIAGGTAKATDYNLGHDGANAQNAYTSGGGGGAGSAGNGTKGGDGYLCDITGENIYYGGGGGGGVGYNSPGANGLGGGQANYGGGGRAAGDYTLTSPQAGGPGVVIVRFTRTDKNETAFDDATGGTVTTCWVDGVKYQVHAFAQSGQFSIPHHGHVEVLVVGGGGGGGGSTSYYGGGGGAGGVVHKSELFITNGVYDIVIGSGGAVGANGGTTTAFGLTAWGGGHGATGGGANAASGASGGGGAGRQWWNDGLANSKGAEANPAYTNAPYCNLGYAGSSAPYPEKQCSGGGGGAGGPAGAGTPDTSNGTHLARPGAAYVCSITGSDVAYAGGGSGRAWSTFYRIAGGGNGSYGGGGDSGGAGGPGVVIVRHQLPKRYGTIVIVE